MARRSRLERLRDPADRIASLAGLALLGAAARAAGLVPPSPVGIAWEAGAKPRWDGGPDFSIAHGGGHVGCALVVPGGRVGLDLEPAGAASCDDLRLALGPGGAPGPAPIGDATALWVAKEAVVKAAGATVAELPAVEVVDAAATFAGCRWRLKRPVLAPGILCAVACEDDLPLCAVCEDAAALLARGP